MSKFGILLTIFSLLVMGCNVGPDYVRPTVAVPKAYKEASKGAWKVSEPKDTRDRGKWWLVFHDSTLNDLEEKATKANQSIAVAKAQYDQALAIVEEARAGFFPTVAATLGDTKSRNTVSTGGALSSGNASNLDTLAVQATWEIDLWGNVRRLVEADQAAACASAAELAAIRLSIQATLAQTYFQLRALDEAQGVFDENVAAYEKFLKLTKNQYTAGTASQLGVLQADAQLQAIKVQAVDNGVARAQYEHAIAVLVGQVPSNFSIPKRTTRLTPPEIPVKVPSALLERRPDIANAERLMAQANAQIGIATAAYFPVLTLSGSRDFYSQNLGHLLSAPTAAWALGGLLAETIFDGGLREATVEAADANYQATVATYRQTVLAAFQDVEDNLSTLRILKNELDAQHRAEVAAQKQVTFTMNGYKAGISSALDVITALNNLYTAKRNTIAIASRQMTAAAGLIKAMGGG